MIRIFYMKLDGDCSKEQSLALYRMLPQERKDLVDRAKREEVRRKRLYTGAFLQYVLSKETGVPVEQLHYQYNQWGKPELDGGRIHFNLSHSGEYVVLAISDAPVGVDVEHKTKGYEALAKRCFCPGECEDVLSLVTEEERQQSFLEYWTMKEAYIKCKGEGMRIPLNSFCIQKGISYGDTEISQEGNGDFYFGTFFLEKGYCVSVCSVCKEDVCKVVVKNDENTRCRLEMTDIVNP